MRKDAMEKAGGPLRLLRRGEHAYVVGGLYSELCAVTQVMLACASKDERVVEATPAAAAV